MEEKIILLPVSNDTNSLLGFTDGEAMYSEIKGSLDYSKKNVFEIPEHVKVVNTHFFKGFLREIILNLKSNMKVINIEELNRFLEIKTANNQTEASYNRAIAQVFSDVY